MNNSNLVTKKQDLNNNNDNFSVSGRFVDASRTQKLSYLTNTDKVNSNLSVLPVTKSTEVMDFSEKSLELFYETRDLFNHDKRALRQHCAIGAQRFRLINHNTLVIYRNFNRTGNSRAGFALASEDSNTDKARLASKQLAYERMLANVDIWAYFGTITFDSSKQDRYDFAPLLQKVTCFCRRRGIRYALVPEPHKDGAVHFHGLFSKELSQHLSEFESVCPKIPVKIKSMLDSGRHVQTCPAMLETFGFNSFEAIRNNEACVWYMTKYISKTFDEPDFTRFSRRRFYISQGLKKPRIILPHQIDLEHFCLVALSSHTEKIYCKRENGLVNSLDSFAHKSKWRRTAPPYSITQPLSVAPV